MTSRREALTAEAAVVDPGATFPYITITDGESTIHVWKRCRVELFDAFWVSEPTSEELKPRLVLHPSQVPDDLWSVLTEEERLISQLEEARCELSSLRSRNRTLLSALGVLFLVLFWLIGRLFNQT